MSDTREWTTIGRITGVVPGKREIRVAPELGREDEFDDPEWVRVERDGQRQFRCRVANVRETSHGVVLQLTAGMPKDWVAELKGGRIVLGEGEGVGGEKGYTLQDLPGFRVLNSDETVLGVVETVYETPANAVIEIAKNGGGTVLVPVLDETIDSVDVEDEVIVVKDIGPYAVDGEAG